MTVLPTLKASVLAAATRRADSAPAVAIAPRARQRRWRPSKRLAAREVRAASSSLLAQEPMAPRRRRHAAAQRLAMSVGVALAAVLGGLSVSGVFAGSSGTAWGVELVSFADASPLVLLDQAGWQVDYANETSAQVGEMHFTTTPVPSDPSAEDNTTNAQLSWFPGTPSSLTDLASSADLTTTAPVLGTVAQVYQYAGGQPGDQDIAALWEYDGRVLEFRAGAADIAAFESLLASLRAVDTNTWLSALPATVVKTTDRAAVIASMLQGVTLPPGFDPSTITGSDLTSDRYQLGAWVTGTVACTWLQLWSNARSSGNSSGVQQAIAAMATAKDWPILQEMSKNGAYPDMIEELAAAMPSGRLYNQSLEDAANSGLGCPARGVPLTAPDSTPSGPAPVPSSG